MASVACPSGKARATIPGFRHLYKVHIDVLNVHTGKWNCQSISQSKQAEEEYLTAPGVSCPPCEPWKLIMGHPTSCLMAVGGTWHST